MLLAFDLDNTIITADDRLPGDIAEAICLAKDKGHAVSVLTGRPHSSAIAFIEQLGVSHYSVNNGALVVGDGEVLERIVISQGEVEALAKRYVGDKALEYAFMLGDTIYVRDPGDKRWTWAHTSNRNVEPFEAHEVNEADKIVFATDGRGEAMLEEISAAHPELVLYLWGDGFLEVTGKGAHKGAALKRLADTLRVPQSETVAFGDGVNDVTMLQWAGRSVAVGHAYDEARDAADEHIPSPEEGGVARWIEDNL